MVILALFEEKNKERKDRVHASVERPFFDTRSFKMRRHAADQCFQNVPDTLFDHLCSCANFLGNDAKSDPHKLFRGMILGSGKGGSHMGHFGTNV